MTATRFIDRSIPPSDRDDAPELSMPAEADPMPPAITLRDETDAVRLARLSRNLTEGSKHVMDAFLLLAEGKHFGYRAAILRAAELLTNAAALSRRLADPRTSRAAKE
jgi:hypothetical protein